MSNPSPDVVAPGTVLAGRYRVERQLGSGGMGSVYLVQHVHTDQRLALKLLHAAIVSDEIALTRFRREARATAKVESDHVVKVTDADVAPELGGVPFLVMEWLKGQSLEEKVSRAGALSPEDVVVYLRQAARALDKAHAVGIVHRDLKPDNLFVTTREDGTPCLKILDFGIAKLTQGEDAQRLKATGTGQVFGTPLYMSPEQIKAELDRICPQSDVWALGIIAHRLLLGNEPWSATTITALVAQIAYEPLPVPSRAGSTLGPAFDAWFARCCAREPADRFPSAGEAVHALAQALHVRDEAPAPSRAASGAPSKPSARRADDVASTAFSATAPIPLSVAAPVGSRAEPTRTSGVSRLVLGALVVLGIAGLAGWMLLRQAPPPADSRVAVDATRDPPSPTARHSLDVTVRLGPSAAPVVEATVSPVVAASTEATAPTVTAVATAAPASRGSVPVAGHHPRQAAPPTAPAPPAATAAPPAVSAAPAATPKKPDDPLGSRY